MTSRLNRNRRPGTAGAAVMASVAMLGASFALAAVSTSASADPTTGTTPPSTPVTTVDPAVTSGSLSQIQARAARAINNRVNSLNFAITQLGNDAGFLGNDGTTLQTTMKTDITNLQALGNKIAGDTSVTVARQDFRSIFSTYRVYWFVLPDADLVVRTDRDVNVTIPAVQKEIATLLGEVTSTTPPRVSKLLTNAQNLVNDAITATNGLSTQLLNYTAAEWNANPRLLATATGAVRHSALDLTRAGLDVKLAERLLTSGKHGSSHGKGWWPTTTTSTTTSTTTTTVAG